AAGLTLLATTSPLAAQNVETREIGEVTTAKKWVGPNHKIKIVAFNDPEIEGITCHLSRPVTGGVSGWAGIAEDKSDASIACRQTGPIRVTGDIDKSPQGEEVFNEDRSMRFKELHVTRFFDEAASTFVY
ncbi:CreA family protein, partial [Klebsiella pneumoniae]|uniref:CreA family protein n=1 Tax=Klebsiella pneumoniae TaxID=573 RepID=UPI003D35CC8A